MNRFPIAITVALLWSFTGLTSESAEVNYERDIKPVLKARCYACHGALKQESDLRVDSGANLLRGGISGPAVVADKIGAGELMQRITAKDVAVRMPPEGQPLSKEEIAKIAAWIKQGAKVPQDDSQEKDPRQHWSFRPPVRHQLPSVSTPGFSHPIDLFIVAKQEASGLESVPLANKNALLRRVYLDLIGVPPTRAELIAFLKDERPGAYDLVVERLLADPKYGERWGRHWMDVWRYSDWYGRRQVGDVRNSYPHIWRWRDWIVNSLNRDKGYDQMVREMLAADELHPNDDERIAALGFIVRNWFSLNYDVWKTDLVEHTGKAFLGLRLNCARCHDHKYDPISQKEYFQFKAFFEPLEFRHDQVPGGKPLSKYIRYKAGSGASLKPIAAGLPRVYDHYFDEKTFMYRLGDSRDRFDRPPVVPGAPASLHGDQLEVRTINLPPRAWNPGLKPFAQQQELNDRRETLAQAGKKLPTIQKERDQLRSQLDELIERRSRIKSDKPERVASFRYRDIIGYWRFEGTSDDRFLADSSENGLALYRVDGGAEPAAPVELEKSGALFPRQIAVTNAKNSGAVKFSQVKKHAFLSTKGSQKLWADQFTVELFARFDQSQTNYNRTIVSYPGAWSLIHRGIDGKTFELRARLFGAESQLIDVTTGSAMKLTTGKPYYLSLQVTDDQIILWSSDLTDNSPLRRFTAKMDRAKFKSVRRPAADVGLCIGNADGTGRVIGLIDEVRYSRRVLPEAEIAAAVGQRPNAAMRKLLHEISTAKEALAQVEARLVAARTKLTLAQTDLAAAQARIVADNNTYYSENSAKAKEIEQLRSNATELGWQTAKLKQQSVIAESKLTLSSKPNAADAKAATSAIKAAEAELKRLTKKPNDYSQAGPVYPKKSTGRRAALAKWMTDRANPLTARVAVNHIWMRHFGRPLVESVVDFGRSGQLPTHPRLLDWLAVELMDNGWRMKHIHRLIVTSRTYRSTAIVSSSQSNNMVDKDNRLLWRFQRQRLEAEVIRDSVLHLAVSLDKKLGGQEVDPKNTQSTRRSMYFAIYPEAGGVMPFVAQFDPPDPCDCYRRTQSIMPQQALALFNSEMTERYSERVAEELLQKGPLDFKSVIERSFEHLLSRTPTGEEAAVCQQFMREQKSLYTKMDAQASTRRALASLVRSLFNHNEFITSP